MSVVIVEKIPETMGGKKTLHCQDESGFRYSFVENDENKNYTIFIEDFEIDCNNAYIQRRIKTTVCAEWHGKMASEAQMFLTYLNLAKKKRDAKCVQTLATLRAAAETDSVALARPQDSRTVLERTQYEQLTEYLEGNLAPLMETSEEYMQAFSMFHNLPKMGELIIVRNLGRHSVHYRFK